jgi:hypothetical protein
MLYRRQLIAYTEAHRPAKLLTDTWWVIAYAISPAINQINTCFVVTEPFSADGATRAAH